MNDQGRGRLMFEHERTLNEFLVIYLENLVDDLDDVDLDIQPVTGMNPPRWILGHLAVNNDYALLLLRERSQCPKHWHRAYARGTDSSSHLENAPTKQELIEQIHRGFFHLRELTRNTTAAEMSKPHSIPFLKETAIQTIGHVISHQMTTHFATHLGQMSFWRRAIGRIAVTLGPTVHPLVRDESAAPADERRDDLSIQF